ncbi:hypothetical protein FH972_015800 [Carpinus fangiana]|uniref:Protein DETOXIFICATION n=1 Tax=Carpinus fangiana TaxID=176857 RepID=A0A5N6RH82_9ROSI|nr:hypothetical protein FH972_015800 [Carpinus fangiana]
MTDTKKDMEQTLLPKGREDKKPGTPISLKWGVFTVELKRLSVLAGPMVAVILSQYMLQVISIMMVGHLGELALSSTAIAISLSGVTGFSFLSLNELGEGNSQGARVVVFTVLFLAVAETSIVSTSILASCHVFGYTFSNEKEVVDYVTTMAPLVSLSILLGSIQGVLSG